MGKTIVSRVRHVISMWLLIDAYKTYLVYTNGIFQKPKPKINYHFKKLKRFLIKLISTCKIMMKLSDQIVYETHSDSSNNPPIGSQHRYNWST